MRIIGLDLGSKRIGVALSNSDLTVATPYEVIYRTGKIEQDHLAILKIIDEWEIERIIVGLPLSLDGTFGPSAKSIKAEIEELKGVTDVRIETFDERFTTVTAEQLLIEQNVRRKRRKSLVDMVAASIILQGWIDSLNNSRTASNLESSNE
ncbi:MAG: Holliday junction resolvase RuvX [Acidimicrobiaceae bacterium]|nr:Holliday junction resolvase RuvX [Acidimicrobiaceae bacterium]